MGFGDRLDDGQPEAEAFVLAGAAGGDALEWFQQPGDLVLGHDWPGVGHDEPAAAGVVVGGHVHAAVGVVVAQGIVEQVGREPL